MLDIHSELHALIDQLLFGPDPWPESREVNLDLSKKLERMGLKQQVAGQPEGTTMVTPLGKKHHIELVMVFIGLWAIDDMPTILEDHGVIDEQECTKIYEQFERLENIKPTLLTLARKAYFELYCSSQTIN
jgi:hypothetical protein